MTVVKVTLLDCSAPLWQLSTSQRQLWRKEDGTLMVSGQPVDAVEVSILTRPVGRVRLRLDDAPRRVIAVSILTRPVGRVRRLSTMSRHSSAPRFQSSPDP